MSDCVFCKIIRGEIPSHEVYEDDDILAIVDVGHVNQGHCLVLSKHHAATMMELQESIAARAFSVANRVAKAIDATFKPDGLTILQANRAAGFQTVPHFHLHVLPRQQDDGVCLTWPAKNPEQPILAETAAKLRAAIDGRTDQAVA
ncbi:MAG: HIT family protein [Hyphomicrobiaceae bacterium]